MLHLLLFALLILRCVVSAKMISFMTVHNITANRECLLETALLERCDGNRNILHACVSRSFPVSAHEPGEIAESQLSSGAANGPLGNKLESIKGAVDALAAAVAAAAAAVRSSGKTF